jgi:hypothetical protein
MLECVIVLPLGNKGTYDVLRINPVPTALGEGKFIYIDADRDILCFNRARQHYFKISEIEMALCKAVVKNSYVRKQKLRLLSSYLLDSCAVKMLQP